ncbi:NACHT domain-containing protein [Mycena rebaudengoi]|nr:NACHT domain-containing protein [Mycena rebaudengoi]
MPLFSNTSGVTINGGTFYQSDGDIHLENNQQLMLYRSVSLEAMHDSADNDAQPKCHPETRTKMLEKLHNWCIGSEWPEGSEGEELDSKPVLWLYGPAGAGKSAIMRTLAERLADSGQLGGSFFFKRSHPTCGNAQKLFTTLAYQLANNIPQIKARISKLVADTPSVVSKSLKVQLLKLVTEPCRQFDTSRPITIIIDGLDECNDSDVQQEVLHCIGHLMREQDSFPLQFLIASRPEPHIREIFQASLFHQLHHSFNVNQSFEDVRKYLEDEFARIHREHHQTMAGVSSPWPSPEVIKYLVDKSSGYFIYATTVIKFVDDRNFRPTEQLEALQHISYLESPLSALDRLYTQILSAVPTRHCHSLLWILRALEFFDFRLYTAGIEQVLALKPGDVQLILRGLHSILRIPGPKKDNYQDERISVHHASFRDFLNDQSRSGEFYVGGLQHQVELGKSVLKALSYTYDNPAINVADPVAL